MSSEKNYKEKAQENYEQQKALLLSRGYVEKSEAIPIRKANLLALYIFIISTVIVLSICNLMWGGLSPLVSVRTIIVLIVFIISIPIHELLHAFILSRFCKERFKSVSFGIIKGTITPYTTCKEPLPIAQYLIAVIFPVIILGIIPAIIGVSIRNIHVIWFALLSICASSGDLIIGNKLMQGDPKGLFLDHPTECGYYHFIKEEKKVVK